MYALVSQEEKQVFVGVDILGNTNSNASLASRLLHQAVVFIRINSDLLSIDLIESFSQIQFNYAKPRIPTSIKTKIKREITIFLQNSIL